MTKIIPFDALSNTNLFIDAVYEGGSKNNSGDDPISKLIPGSGNMGGFRSVGGWDSPRLVVLYSTMDDPDWPDFLDLNSGVFTYFGDNKMPGSELHDTRRHGNKLLRSCFAILRGNGQRKTIPPFLLFTRGSKGRDVVFRGIAIPGVEGTNSEDLVAVWRTKKGERFQNYRAKFTVLDVPLVSRKWISALAAGNPFDISAPAAWKRWAEGGAGEALRTIPVLEYRTPEQQLPRSERDRSLVGCIYGYFKNNPHGFEYCAAQLAVMMDSNINIEKVTRPSVDGGRDAIGVYRIGPAADRISLDFALEAKCYEQGNGVGVKELSRLISRLRHREFGILVTTSYLAKQAYEELRGDRHPVIVISGIDIANILVKAGLGTPGDVKIWLEEKFPSAGKIPSKAHVK